MIRKEEIRKYRKEAAKALPLFTVFRERMEKMLPNMSISQQSIQSLSA